MRSRTLWKTFLLQDGEKISYKLVRVLGKAQTRYQKIEIVESETYGRAIFIDDKPQSSAVDHFIFNEMMIHGTALRLKNPARVFIGGGGPGSCLQEILRYGSVKHVILCDIDRTAHQLYQKYTRSWFGDAFSDSRVRVVHEDARKYLGQQTDKYDMIVWDVPDPLAGSQCQRLHTVECYRLVKSRLDDGGAFVTQAGRLNLNNLGYHCSIRRTLQTVFPIVDSFGYHIPFYGEAWGFCFASVDPSLIIPITQTGPLLEERKLVGLRFINAAMLNAIYALPPYLQNAFAGKGSISTDRVPLAVT